MWRSSEGDPGDERVFLSAKGWEGLGQWGEPLRRSLVSMGTASCDSSPAAPIMSAAGSEQSVTFA